MPSFPEALGIQPVVLNQPFGRTCGIEVLWSSPDLKLEHEYIDHLAALHKVVHNGVRETTISEWIHPTKSIIPPRAFGTNRSLTVRNLTDEMVNIICSNITKMLDDKGTVFSLHVLRGSPAKSNEGSVFLAREPHIVVEMIGTTSEPKNEEAAIAWVLNFRDELAAITKDQKGVISQWVALTPPSEASL